MCACSILIRYLNIELEFKRYLNLNIAYMNWNIKDNLNILIHISLKLEFIRYLNIAEIFKIRISSALRQLVS